MIALAGLVVVAPSSAAAQQPDWLGTDASTTASRYVCALDGTSTVWEPFQHSYELPEPWGGGVKSYWYAKYVIEGSAECLRVGAGGESGLLTGTLTLAGEASTGFPGSGPTRWDAARRQWYEAPSETTWGWLTSFYGATNRDYGEFVPDHATIRFSNGTSIEFGYGIGPSDTVGSAGMIAGAPGDWGKKMSVHPASGPRPDAMLSVPSGEGGYVRLSALDGDATFSARSAAEAGGVAFRANDLQLGPDVTER